MGVKVAKFGGTSVADAIQITKLGEIVKRDKDIRYVVVSAPGKRFEEDSKITDILYSCKTHMEHHLPYEQLFQVVKDRFSSMEANLKIQTNLSKDLDDIFDHMRQGASADYVASRGEYLNAKLIADYLGYDFVDAEGIIMFDDKGKFLEEATNKAVKEMLKQHKNAVIPGFYGSKPDGSIKTFSRGGSDITGSIVARAINADIYENWTDVSGFLVADPRIVRDPKPISEISYKELRELSYMGASVLHEDAIYPVRHSSIPIKIRNTNAPDDPGTLITDNPSEESRKRIVTGIAGSKDFTVIALYKNRMHSEKGFLRRMTGILEDFNIPIEHMPTGIDTISVVLDDDEIDGRIDEIVEEMEAQLKPDDLEVVEGMALIATVGQGMSFRPGVSARLFSALAEEKINVRMIDQGSSEMNIIIGVKNEDFEESIRAIYKAFI
jgi:aspartate kinase